ncbi:hypothetical protein KRX57_02125 [Weeksellaceae bacterium TAE3-ERU29]|nr:hypothetical protein [Weeksellaceae bacterium TAE3-ERU29]
MKKLSILVALICSAVFVQAQKKGTDWLKLGIHAGIPVADSKDGSSFALGADVKYQFLDFQSFGLGVATGYTNYFGKDNNKDTGVIPVAALLRYYPTQSFFIGSDLGVGFVTGGNDTETGFYYRPEVGYHSDEWNLFLFYQGTKIDTGNVGSVGLGVNYNLVRPMR